MTKYKLSELKMPNAVFLKQVPLVSELSDRANRIREHNKRVNKIHSHVLRGQLISNER